MSALLQTPSQTVGPYFAYGLTSSQYGYDFKSLFPPQLAQPHAKGQRIQIIGQVLDGAGNSMADAMVEISQADADGHWAKTPAEVATSGFSGFGRCGTGTLAQNQYLFDSVKPGATAAGQAPYISVCVTARGMLVHSFTRIYFDDEAAANAEDSVLASVPVERRTTLIAKREDSAAGVVYRFDIRMQGPQETVFFDL